MERRRIALHYEDRRAMVPGSFLEAIPGRLRLPRRAGSLDSRMEYLDIEEFEYLAHSATLQSARSWWLQRKISDRKFNRRVLQELETSRDSADRAQAARTAGASDD